MDASRRACSPRGNAQRRETCLSASVGRGWDDLCCACDPWRLHSFTSDHAVSPVGRVSLRAQLGTLSRLAPRQSVVRWLHPSLRGTPQHDEAAQGSHIGSPVGRHQLLCVLRGSVMVGEAAVGGRRCRRHCTSPSDQNGLICLGNRLLRMPVAARPWRMPELDRRDERRREEALRYQ